MSNSLSHFGILGMRWGRRKAATSSGGGSHPAAKPEPNHSEDHKKVTELRKKKPSELTNQEMQAVITRMQLEKQFAELNAKKVSAGQKVVMDLLKNAGKTMAKEYVDANAKKGSAYLIKNFSLA